MIKAKKKYGQNFLVDKGVINKIIQAINPNNSEKILEIGPDNFKIGRKSDRKSVV